MNKTVFITGAHMGTGYGIAERVAKEGWDVVLTSRNGAAAKESAEKLGADYGIAARGYECTIRHAEQVKGIFADLDAAGIAVSTLVLNAADLGFGTDPAKGMDLFTVPIEDFQRVLETNLVWNFMIVRQAALRMREAGYGAIVFLSSNTAYRAIPNRTAYIASKGGILAMVKALAVDLGPYGIRCNAVLPGTIKTERWAAMGKKQIVNGELTPIGDISDFEDIANAVWYFGTEASKNVTGAELTVDGGMSCQLYPQILNELRRK